MKQFFTAVLAVLAVTVFVMSCTKYSSGVMYPPIDRKIRFQLYTNKDFTGNTSVINFSLFIKNANNVLLDSALAGMQIKDIPDSAHKLIIEKTIPGNNTSDLAAGFRYEIENVGHSSYTDTSKAGNTFKVIDFDFQ